MLRATEFDDIKRDCLTMTELHFPHCRTPQDLSFAQSAALFPDATLKLALSTAYDRDCASLFFGPYPSFDEVLAGFEEIRALL